jgi:hypothetical protein
MINGTGKQAINRMARQVTICAWLRPQKGTARSCPQRRRMKGAGCAVKDPAHAQEEAISLVDAAGALAEIVAVTETER